VRFILPILLLSPSLAFAQEAEDEETSEDVYSPGDELPEDMQESRRLSRRFLKQMISKEILKSQKG